MTTRRDLLKTLPPLVAGVVCTAVAERTAVASTATGVNIGADGAALKLSPSSKSSYAPLETVRVESSTPGKVLVEDGEHRVYVDRTIKNAFEFVVGGSLGSHSVSLYSTTGQLLTKRTFHVDCATEVNDEGGTFRDLLKALYWTMATDGPVGAQRYQNQVFTYWVSWLMDNTNTQKGMKWFWPEAKSNVDFYAASQREDGMIWENFEPRTPPMSDWERRFGYADFDRPAEDGFLDLRRAPVESHVEHFFIEAVYYTWKATGDTKWMQRKLDNAIRAVEYATSDPYRWSGIHGLLKRPFTIDTWDFTPDFEAELVDGDIMVVDLKKTHMGIFFGDNTGMIAGLRRLAEMLEYANRGTEAAKYRRKADDMERALDTLSWNGEFYVHWIPEDSSFKPDTGVDMHRQVALSNAYSLNRGISHHKCVSIIKTYQRIKGEMPKSSPGEFYAIYPPFEKGFGTEQQKWEYMNGGVMTCTAGELAHGAFEHGFESYGVDILRRLKQISDRFRGFLPGILRGKASEPPVRTFKHVDMKSVVNADFGQGSATVLGWMDEGDMNLASMPTGPQEFRGVPFQVIEPSSNEGRGCLAISANAKFLRKASLTVNASARSFYLLHTVGGRGPVGTLTIRYKDGSSHVEYMLIDKNVGHWWAPRDSEFDTRYGPQWPETMQVAWRGGNSKFKNLGVWVTGFENPHPERVMSTLEFEAFETGTKWMILGVTLSDAPVYLPPYHDVSQGMPNNWCAAAVTFALVEGLAGVKDTGVAFDRALIAPRWAAAQTNKADVTVRYGASNGYVSYKYYFDQPRKRLVLDFTTNAEKVEVAILLPDGTESIAGTLDGRNCRVTTDSIEDSRYARVAVAKGGVHKLELELA